jgi:hypothetical protein
MKTKVMTKENQKLVLNKLKVMRGSTSIYTPLGINSELKVN